MNNDEYNKNTRIYFYFNWTLKKLWLTIPDLAYLIASYFSIGWPNAPTYPNCSGFRAEGGGAIVHLGPSPPVLLRH